MLAASALDNARVSRTWRIRQRSVVTREIPPRFVRIYTNPETLTHETHGIWRTRALRPDNDSGGGGAAVGSHFPCHITIP
jgi:hypothetical protein